MNRFQTAKDIFAKVFYLERLWNSRGDKWFAGDGLTTKQWFLLVMVGSKFEKPPALKEVARAMKTSHQNVKSIALKLQKNGFVELLADYNDRRVTRIKLRDNVEGYFKARSAEIEKYILALFEEVDTADLELTNRLIDKLIDNAEREEK